MQLRSRNITLSHCISALPPAPHGQDRHQLPHRAQCNNRTGRSDRGRRMRQAHYVAPGCHRQVALVAQFVHYRVELHGRQMGE